MASNVGRGQKQKEGRIKNARLESRIRDQETSFVEGPLEYALEKKGKTVIPTAPQSSLTKGRGGERSMVHRNAKQ